MEVKNMKKKYILNIILGALILSITLVFINTIQAKGSVTELNCRTIVVQDGDSLWNIVKNNCSGYKDIRKAIYDIKNFNNLTSSNISPGQKIKIPSELSNN